MSILFSNKKMFPILGGRLLKYETESFVDALIYVSNPWREAIEDDCKTRFL